MYLIIILVNHASADCSIPQILRGKWFSWEIGKPTETNIDATTMTKKGYCLNFLKSGSTNFTFIFHDTINNCYNCVKAYPRTLNVFEKIEGECVTLIPEDVSFERVCKGIKGDQQLITLFNENYIPINCRSSLEGVWQFAYQVHILIKDLKLNNIFKNYNNKENMYFRIVFVLLENVIIQMHKFAHVKRLVHNF